MTYLLKIKSLFRRPAATLRQPDIYDGAELNAAIWTIEKLAERYGLDAEVRFKLKRK